MEDYTFDSKLKLDNFGFLDAKFVSILLTKIKKKKEQYVACILIHLECDEQERTTKAVHLECDMVDTKDDILLRTLQSLGLIFDSDKILDTVLVFDKKGDQIEELSLEQVMKKHLQGATTPLVKRGS